MTHDEPPQRFQPRAIFSTWLGVVLLFAFFGLLALVVIGASSRGNSYEKKRAKVRAEKLDALYKEKLSALTTYGWVDKSKGVVRIPVEEAMMITVAELSQKTPAPANPIAAADLSPPPQSTAPLPQRHPRARTRAEPRSLRPLAAPIRRPIINPLRPSIHRRLLREHSRGRRPLQALLRLRPRSSQRQRPLPHRLHRPHGQPRYRSIRKRHEDFSTRKSKMNPADLPLRPPATAESDVTIRDVEQVERALIDASTRLPVLFFYGSAIAWLLLGTLFAGFTSWKLHAPDLLANISFLTWGRVRPAHMNVMIYGWASMAGIGTAIWLMARLCRTTLRHPLLLIVGGAFWNLGVLLGVGGILAGESTGYEWLEFPPYAAIVLFVAYSLVVSWAMLMFRFRRGDHIYVTQWYLLAAFLWFPWVYGATQVMLFVVPLQGVMQEAVTWWFANNLLFLWFGAIGLGTAYYMIPKVIGRPVYSYHLAAIGFWTYALFASWTGMQRLVDGPFPAWMITASIAATILTIIPVATVGLNHHMTMRGYFGLMRYSPTLRFTVFGAISYTVFSLLGVLLSLRSVAGYVHFTEASVAYSHMGLYAFFTMIMFGSMYYIVPRLVGREWRYASLIKLHFWSSTYGIGLMVLMLLVGGIAQGSSQHDSSLAFSQSTNSILPYLRGRSVSGMLLTIAHLVFAFHFGLMLFGLGRTASVPTFLNPQEEEALEARL